MLRTCESDCISVPEFVFFTFNINFCKIHFRLNTHLPYILESHFNFIYARLGILDIPREKNDLTICKQLRHGTKVG